MQSRQIIMGGLLVLALVILVVGGWLRLRPNVEIGARLVQNNCGVCHDLTAGRKNEKGPPLWGVVNRKAGSTDFPYSGAFLKRMADSPVVWTEKNLKQFITDPNLFVPQTQMAERNHDHPLAFEGMESASSRRDVVAWLKTLR